MYLGVDYYPEHWDDTLIDNDLERIRNTGANTIRIGEFAWHLMEKQEGKYDFSYFDNVISKAKKFGLNIIFGTPTATFPAWLSNQNPSILSQNENGNIRIFGGRRQYCFNSKVYNEYSLKIVKKLVAHYKDEYSIIAWQIDNELGHEGSDMCFCKQCHQKFQEFLENKYKSIDKLNNSYGTVFWGQTYNSFYEIPIPIKTITSHNPSLQLDWARFRSYSISLFAHKHIEAVRNSKGQHQIVTTNFYGGFFDKCYDQNVISKEIDIVSYDNYPVWGGLEKPLSPANIAMTHDYIRGLKNCNYWILEELMGAQGHTEIGYLPRPEEAKLWAYQAMAKGCESLLFFRWRSMTRGAEQFCQGILDGNNKDNRKLKEVSEFFANVVNYEDVFKSEINSEVAIVYDFDNRWSWNYQPQSSGFDYNNEVLRLYEGFHRYNVGMDIISTSKDIWDYKVLVLPVMQIIDEELKLKLQEFVKAGGVVVFSYRTAIKDRDNNVIFKENAPCYLNSLCGIEVEEYESLGSKTNIDLECSNRLVDRSKAGVWRDLIKPITAETLFKYTEDFYKKYSAVTKNRYGNGIVYYVGCGIDKKGIAHIVNNVISESKISYEESPEGVEIVYRGTDNKYKIILNHNSYEVKYNKIILKPLEVKIEGAK